MHISNDIAHLTFWTILDWPWESYNFLNDGEAVTFSHQNNDNFSKEYNTAKGTVKLSSKSITMDCTHYLLMKETETENLILYGEHHWSK